MSLYPELVGVGIKVHREIDYFTDQHEVVRESTRRLRVTHRHYAGVIVDMFYDHLLAVHFDKYSNEQLESFAATSYQLLQENVGWFPAKAQNMLPYMIRGNWLLNYREVAGIHRALQGISRRTKFNVQLERAVQDLQKHYALYENEFNEFFPQLNEHISIFREDLINSGI